MIVILTVQFPATVPASSSVAPLVLLLSAGEEMTTVGAFLSKKSVRVSDSFLPRESVSERVTMLPPSESSTGRLKIPSAPTGAGEPLIDTSMAPVPGATKPVTFKTVPAVTLWSGSVETVKEAEENAASAPQLQGSARPHSSRVNSNKIFLFIGVEHSFYVCDVAGET